MMKIFSITGWSGSGKTTLTTRLIEHFSAQKKRVVAVKNTPHMYHLEPEGKDSFKFLQAGAGKVYLAARNECLSMRRVTGKEDIFAILEQEVHQDNCDILLLEGLIRQDIPKIEVFDSRKHDAPKFPLDQLAAIVTYRPFTGEIPNFDSNNINDISSFMEEYHE